MIKITLKKNVNIFLHLHQNKRQNIRTPPLHGVTCECRGRPIWVQGLPYMSVGVVSLYFGTYSGVNAKKIFSKFILKVVLIKKLWAFRDEIQLFFLMEDPFKNVVIVHLCICKDCNCAFVLLSSCAVVQLACCTVVQLYSCAVVQLHSCTVSCCTVRVSRNMH